MVMLLEEDVVMQTECTDIAYSTDTGIVPFKPVLDQIAPTSDDPVTDGDAIWMPMSPCQQPIWPRVWPGL